MREKHRQRRAARRGRKNGGLEQSPSFAAADVLRELEDREAEKAREAERCAREQQLAEQERAAREAEQKHRGEEETALPEGAAALSDEERREQEELRRREKQREEEHSFISSLPGVSEVLFVKKTAVDRLEAKEEEEFERGTIVDPEGDVPDEKTLSPEELKQVRAEALERILREEALERRKQAALFRDVSESDSRAKEGGEVVAEDAPFFLRADERRAGEVHTAGSANGVADGSEDETQAEEQGEEQNEDRKRIRRKALGEGYNSRPWTLFYDPLLKESYEYPDENCFVRLEKALLAHPNDIALIDAFSRMTNQQLLREIYMAAAAFKELGVGAGRAVTLCLPNNMQFVIAFYALQRLHAVAHVLHPLTPAKRLIASMRRARSYILLTTDLHYENQIEELRESHIHYVIVTSSLDSFYPRFRSALRFLQLLMPKPSFSLRKLKEKSGRMESLLEERWEAHAEQRRNAEGTETRPREKRLFWRELRDRRDLFVKTQSREIRLLKDFVKALPTKEKRRRLEPMRVAVNCIRWSEFMGIRSTSALPRERPNDENRAERPAVFLSSGGTLDEPKTIILSSGNMNALSIQAPGIFGRKNLRGLKIMAILPFFHAYGLCMQLHAALCNGMSCVLMSRYAPKLYARVFIREQPEVLIGVPTFYEALLQNSYLNGQKMSFLKAAFCGGDQLKPEMKQKIDRYFMEHHAMISLREGYGLSETSSVAAITPAFGNRLRSVGLPIADLDFRIGDKDSGALLPPGSIGEIQIAGPTVFLGYLEGNEDDAKVFIHEHGRRYLRTGDLGFLDEDGFLYYIGRKKRMIKVSGISIYPSEVEAVIREVDGVEDAVCIAGFDPYRMSVIKAFVLPSPSVRRETGAAIGKDGETGGVTETQASEEIPAAPAAGEQDPRTEEPASREKTESGAAASAGESAEKTAEKETLPADGDGNRCFSAAADERQGMSPEAAQAADGGRAPSGTEEQDTERAPDLGMQAWDPETGLHRGLVDFAKRGAMAEAEEQSRAARIEEAIRKEIEREQKTREARQHVREAEERAPETDECSAAELSERIRAHCAERLIRHAIPEQIIYVDHFPRNALGKIKIGELERLLYEERRGESNIASRK